MLPTPLPTLRILLLSLAAAAALTSGLARSASADEAAGRRIAEHVCSKCHEVHSEEAKSPNPRAPNFARLAADPSVTGYSLQALLRTPHRTMPEIMLSNEELDDVVAYLLSLKPEQ
jgi:mono/diheme cytochrome c family protein